MYTKYCWYVQVKEGYEIDRKLYIDILSLEIAVHDSYFSLIGHRLDATNAWGHINIFAKGAGHAVAQLDVNYGVDYEPFKVEYLIWWIWWNNYIK